MSHLSHVLAFVTSTAWAMEPERHRQMMQILLRRADGVRLSEEELEAATGTKMPKRASSMTIEKGVATIPIHGVIAHRASAVGRLSSRVGTSVEHIREDLQTALNDPGVQAILLDVDSPGGSVSGIDELAAEIRAAREKLPIHAHTESLMASAAYYLASQAHRITAARSAVVGSIGVIASFVDAHRAYANEGLDPVVVKSVPAKGSVQSNGTFSDADRADVQREVDAFHELFVASVAEGRGIDLEAARAMGDGKVYLGREALERGFVDAIGTHHAARREVRRVARELVATSPGADVAAGAPRVQEDPDMTQKTESAADQDLAAKKNTDTAPAPKTPTAEDTAKASAAAAKAAADAERQRAADILGLADVGQNVLAQQLIADEKVTVAEAAKRLTADRRERLAPPKSEPEGNGNDGNLPRGDQSKRIEAMPEGEAKWKAEFEANQKLQAEFGGDFSLYAGWKRNAQNVAASKRDA